MAVICVVIASKLIICYIALLCLESSRCSLVSVYLCAVIPTVFAKALCIDFKSPRHDVFAASTGEGGEEVS